MSTLSPLPSIPIPITNGRTVAGTYNGIPVQIDSLGNMTDSSGTIIGNLSSPSVISPSTSSASTSTSSSMLSNLQSIGTLASTVSGFLNRFTLEDGITIAVGMILISAGVFSFRSSQTVVTTVGKIAKKGAEVASA